MIKHIDEMLKLWAQELHTPEFCGGSGGGSMLALLMDCKGELIRGTRGSRVLLDESADIEIIVNKHLAPELYLVVKEHYCNQDSLLAQKILHCGCSRKTYYERLHQAHRCVETMLRGKKAA
ncbi:Transcriptional regulator [Pseudomonas donghuensis]|uniref:PA0613 family protein n=1 Tax=Pseudomonas donghuensis TaxID=1163398 RepID=UPI0039E12CF0